MESLRVDGGAAGVTILEREESGRGRGFTQLHSCAPAQNCVVPREMLKATIARVIMSMSATISSSHIQGLLGYQDKVGKPPQQVCTVIANLRDLCDLQEAGIGMDWRRGTGEGGGGSGQRSLGLGSGHGGGRPVFRSAGFGTSSGPSLPRITAQRSFGSLSATSGPGSPSVGSMPPSTPSTPSSGRYQSMFKNSTQQVNDKIVNNILLGKMNKFSGKTYNETRDFLYQILGSGEPDLSNMVCEFMTLVFKKAATEETFRPLYAKLLCELSQRYKVILEEMQRLQANYLDIFEDVQEVPEGAVEYKKFLEKNEQKQYRQGYSQFLAECAALEILDLSNLEQTFEHLSGLMLKYAKVEDKRTLVEEYAYCLVFMSKVLAKKQSPFFIRARQALSRVCATAVDTLLKNASTYVSFSPRARCIMLDVKDNLSS